MFMPLLIISITTFCGIILWGGMDYSILGLPASYHDIIYLLILALSIEPKERRRTCHKSVCWFVAGLFVVQSFMQIIDIRPVGSVGLYELHVDNIVNALYILLYLVILTNLIYLEKVRFSSSIAYLYSVSILFLAFNFLLTISYVRESIANYAIVYDIFYYAALYAIVVSANRRVKDFVRSCIDNIYSMLRVRSLDFQ